MGATTTRCSTTSAIVHAPRSGRKTGLAQCQVAGLRQPGGGHLEVSDEMLPLDGRQGGHRRRHRSDERYEGQQRRWVSTSLPIFGAMPRERRGAGDRDETAGGEEQSAVHNPHKALTQRTCRS